MACVASSTAAGTPTRFGGIAEDHHGNSCHGDQTQNFLDHRHRSLEILTDPEFYGIHWQPRVSPANEVMVEGGNCADREDHDSPTG